MNIAGLNVRIMIQKNETVTDRIGNHKSVWTDYLYRILLGDRIYNITHVDDMGFRKNSRKFMTKLEAR